MNVTLPTNHPSSIPAQQGGLYGPAPAGHLTPLPPYPPMPDLWAELRAAVAQRYLNGEPPGDNLDEAIEATRKVINATWSRS